MGTSPSSTFLRAPGILWLCRGCKHLLPALQGKTNLQISQNLCPRSCASHEKGQGGK